jgi:hypothetical protein
MMVSILYLRQIRVRSKRVVISSRVRSYIDREIAQPKRSELLKIFDGLSDGYFGSAVMSERISTALAFLVADGSDIEEIRGYVESDPRDVLMWSGLAVDDWRHVMDDRLGTA